MNKDMALKPTAIKLAIKPNLSLLPNKSYGSKLTKVKLPNA
jgi:hypothetical protein